MPIFLPTVLLFCAWDPFKDKVVLPMYLVVAIFQHSQQLKKVLLSFVTLSEHGRSEKRHTMACPHTFLATKVFSMPAVKCQQTSHHTHTRLTLLFFSSTHPVYCAVRVDRSTCTFHAQAHAHAHTHHTRVDDVPRFCLLLAGNVLSCAHPCRRVLAVAGAEKSSWIA